MANVSELDLNSTRVARNFTTETELVSEAVFQTVGGASIVIMLVGIPGNFLVIAAISLNKHLRTAANYLVLSLSVFDFLFLSTVVPVHASCYITGWEPPTKFCWVIGFFTNWLLAGSVLSTGFIAINRYIAIVRNNRQNQFDGKINVAVSSAITILFPLFLLSPTFEGSFGTFGYERLDRNCGWLPFGVMKIIIIACCAIIPFISMTLCYIHIVVYVVASRKRVANIGQTSTAFGATNSRTETRLSQMLVLVYVVYVVTSSPSLILHFVVQMGVDVPYSLYPVVFIIVWISSAANPVMYGLVNKKYRDAYKNVGSRLVSTVTPTQRETIQVIWTLNLQQNVR